MWWLSRSPPHAFKIRGGCEGGGKGYLGMDEQVFTITTGHDQQVAVPVTSFKCAGCGETIMHEWAWGDYCDYCGHDHREQVAVPIYFGNAEGGAREVPFMTSQNLGGTAGISNQTPLVGVPCYSIRPDVTPKFYEDIAGTIGATDYKDPTCVSTQYAVRRLTPVECERLQGFPDNYTNIPWRNKPEAPDGPRHKALGNSWAVPCVTWIGNRINQHLESLA